MRLLFLPLCCVALLLMSCAAPRTSSTGEAIAPKHVRQALDQLKARATLHGNVQALAGVSSEASHLLSAAPILALAVGLPPVEASITVVEPLAGPVARVFFADDRFVIQDVFAGSERDVGATPAVMAQLLGVSMPVADFFALLFGFVPHADNIQWHVLPDGSVRSADAAWRLHVDSVTKEVTRVTKYRIGSAGDVHYTVEYNDHRMVSGVSMPYTLRFQAGRQGASSVELRFDSIEIFTD